MECWRTTLDTITRANRENMYGSNARNVREGVPRHGAYTREGQDFGVVAVRPVLVI